MKKTFIVLMMVLLATMLIVSCDDNSNDFGKTTYEVGDTGPAGGTIFYVNPDYVEGSIDSDKSWKYLEAGKSDLMNGTVPANYLWGPDENENLETGKAIGDGLDNTKILANKGSSYAAAYAVYNKDLYGTGDCDWFLPSKGELLKLYENRESGGLKGSFATLNYWSSSENIKEETSGNVVQTNYQALRVDFNTGEEKIVDRSSYSYVRPIRRF